MEVKHETYLWKSMLIELQFLIAFVYVVLDGTEFEGKIWEEVSSLNS